MESYLKVSNGFRPFWLPSIKTLQLESLDMGVLDFISRCYNKFDGGYGDYPSEQQSFVNSTAKALICLNIFQKSDMFKRNEIYSFLRGCQNSDGGFGITTSKNNLYSSSLESTFYSIIALNIIGYIPRLKLHIPKTVNWVISHYNIDGGFHGDNSVISNEYYTFLALLILNLLKQLDRVDINLTSNYLVNAQIKKNPEVTITTSRLLSLYLLKMLERLNLTISTSRLARCQNKNGGYRNKKISIVYRSDMNSTFQAILGLYLIGKTKKIKKENAIKWILSCQNDDGGFGNKPNSKSSISYTYDAIMSLFYLTNPHP